MPATEPMPNPNGWGFRLLMLKAHVFQGNALPNADQIPTIARFGDGSGASRLGAEGAAECRGDGGVPQRHA